MILEYLKTYAIAILSAVSVFLLVMLILCSWYAYSTAGKLQKAREELAIVKNASEEQKVKVVTADKVVEVIKWRTKENLRIEKEYIYDKSKSECCNAIDRMRSTFSGVRDENGLLEVPSGKTEETNSTRLQ